MSAWWLAIPLTVGIWSALYLWLGAWLIERWQNEPVGDAEPLPPVTLLRPLKPGVPDLRGKLEALARALRPGDQLVLGAAADSAELRACQALQQHFPDREIVAVPCREGAAVNPKISKLVQMNAVSRHEHLILSDSEALIDAAWLEAFRREWAASGADALTTGYRFVGAESWPQRLDAAPALLSLWPGLALVRRWGRVDFTLGACTGVRRGDLTAVGGWAAFGEFLAEDRELGAALAAASRTVRLGKVVTTLESDPLAWRDWWRHQCRVAATYRAGTPGGFAGMVLTHGSTAALVLAATGRLWCVAAAVLVLLLRWLAARRLARVLGFPIRSLALSMFLGGLMETVAWGLSWFPRRIWWSGRGWRIGRGGKLVVLPPNGAVQ